MTSKEMQTPLQEFPKIDATTIDAVNARFRQDPTLLIATKANLHPDEQAFVDKVKQLTAKGESLDATTAAFGSAVLTGLYVEESMLTDNQPVTTIPQRAIDDVHRRLDEDPTLMARINERMFGENPEFRRAVGNMAQLNPQEGSLRIVITNVSALSALVMAEQLRVDLGLGDQNPTPPAPAGQ